MPKIRTTFRPDEEIEVSEEEAADLRSYGVVLEHTSATTDDGLRKAAERQVAARTNDKTEG